jgi:hypothetical protein
MTNPDIPPALAPVNAAEFDLDRWIDGTCGITTTAKIYQRGDLLPEIERLQRELEIAKKIPKDQRGVGDLGPEAVEEQWAKVAQELVDSALIVHIQDRTEARRRHLREKLTKERKLTPEKNQDDQETLILAQLADAIIKVEQGGAVKNLPDGFGEERLQKLKNKLGDAGLHEARDKFLRVVSEAPEVTAPLSRTSSSDRGGIT